MAVLLLGCGWATDQEAHGQRRRARARRPCLTNALACTSIQNIRCAAKDRTSAVRTYRCACSRPTRTGRMTSTHCELVTQFVLFQGTMEATRLFFGRRGLILQGDAVFCRENSATAPSLVRHSGLARALGRCAAVAQVSPNACSNSAATRIATSAATAPADLAPGLLTPFLFSLTSGRPHPAAYSMTS